MSKAANVPSSFRDPSGFLFTKEGVLYRQVNKSYQPDFDLLIGSGLYQRLVKEDLMIPFKKVSLDLAPTGDAYQVVQPQAVDFISYPYEWCFSELKDAALLTLKIQKMALEYGMSLKDASAYNIQFVKGQPVLIDHLSFEKFEEKPWVAYRQFCQHFLAPLALASYSDIRLIQLMRIYIDGIPLDLAAKLLPKKALIRPQLLAHLYLHAKSQQFFAGRPQSGGMERAIRFRKSQLLGLVSGLEGAVRGLEWKPRGTEWADYYENTNYSRGAFRNKAEIVERFVRSVKPRIVWDLGANTGEFSRVAMKSSKLIVSSDIDPAAVEINYREVKSKGENRILPLVLDLTNPSGALGWAGQERMSFAERGPADTVMALALVHHLAISNNLPFAKIAEFFAGICREFLIIEFVPKEDSQVQRLLATREDIFDHYTQDDFEREFGKLFTVTVKESVKGSKRTVYLLKKK
ncbi:MAG: hypothetical protein XU08_C0001G0011 [candidate division WWE3 bacterium CSP1-7]|uniref:SAM-dependent methyltransferase n=1 Tax=candidate division WWE3 bacterium CSP1-7 TaxID=1576480 RepID=A0A0T5ZY69_UNCKA|nr:MAG: hypothetical protein XU08_C0001G0011 [candidate division WWE3 bacterium CSP1-7]HJZ05578.1 SAM-dependent methyltransferase [Patescibacteria group bacterium]